MIDFNAYKTKLLKLGVHLNNPVPDKYWQKDKTNCPLFLRNLYNESTSQRKAGCHTSLE